MNLDQFRREFVRENYLTSRINDRILRFFRTSKSMFIRFSEIQKELGIKCGSLSSALAVLRRRGTIERVYYGIYMYTG